MDNLKPEHIQGKKIKEVIIKKIEVQLNFEDGSTAFFRLSSLGLNGDKLLCDFYYPSTDEDEFDELSPHH